MGLLENCKGIDFIGRMNLVADSGGSTRQCRLLRCRLGEVAIDINATLPEIVVEQQPV